MANTVLKTDRFPDATSVSAYPAAQAERQAVAGQAPVGMTAVETVSSVAGTTTFTTLVAGTPYRCYGLVGSENRWVQCVGTV